MKKICVCLWAVLLFAPLCALEAVVVSVLGKAEVQTTGEWQPMTVGAKISSGAIISTGFKSQAVLEIGKSTVTVQPLSRLTLEQLTQRRDTDTSKVYLDAGSIKADVKAAENKRVGFTVKSPVATASVRGTAGVIDAFGFLESTSGVWLVDPDTAIEAAVEGYSVAKGSAIAVDTDGIVVEPQKLNVRIALNAAPTAVAPSAFGADEKIAFLNGAINASETENLPSGRGKIAISLFNIGWE